VDTFLALLDVETLMSSSVNSGRPERSFADRLTDTENLVKPLEASLSQAETAGEARDAQRRQGVTTITKVTEKKIRQLYKSVGSMARVRQELDLDVPLSRIATIVNKPG
jgi:hypothetical protein